jgi:iron complex outermembrane receptor protein
MYLNKFTLAGEVRDLGGFVRTLSGQWMFSDYQHQEIESGVIATTFKNKGSDLRLQAEHKKFDVAGGSLSGVFGLQTGNNDFSALGAEAFVPSTTTRQLALFVLEGLSWGDTTLGLGGRIGRDKVDTDGDGLGQTQFGPPQSRTFTPFSAAIGGIHNLTPQWQLSGNLAYTERAPTFYELYANGLHVATGAYEVGNPNMAIEKGSNLDVALQWKDGADRVKAGAFYSDFSNYIALLATGQVVDTNEGEVPVFDFTGVPAKLYGLEVEGTWRVLDSAQQVDLDAKLDLMRATNDAIDQPLPRIPPARLTAGVSWKMGDWGARAEVIYAAEQDLVPTYDMPTPSYTLINLSASYKLRMAGTEGFFFARLNNLTNELAYNATSIGTVRPLAPLPGRGLMVGLRLSF